MERKGENQNKDLGREAAGRLASRRLPLVQLRRHRNDALGVAQDKLRLTLRQAVQRLGDPPGLVLLLFLGHSDHLLRCGLMGCVRRLRPWPRPGVGF